ncbi:MAG: hypothetical protein CVU98_02100 [Firmicutes bacterium HGW-Firmicutes-3]|jgi:flagellar protein FlgJ|nr:MAG: hypothetical protein CVU98_02100 [Firmicutes bacterium HGW-Firmicutes-3]
MDISGLGSGFLNSLTSAETVKSKVEDEDFQNIIKRAMENKDDEALKDACAEFESYYLNKVFTEMRKSIPKSGLYEETQGRKIYEDMLYEAYSKEISKGQGAGIKDMLFQQLKK